MVYKLEGRYAGKSALKADLIGLPQNQGGGLLQCSVVPKDEGSPSVTMYVNTGNYDTVSITPVADEA